MSDTVKLIIEIPTDFYEITKAKVDKNMTNTISAISIANGIPLDTVKAEIKDKWNRFDIIRVDTVFRILDNIGRK